MTDEQIIQGLKRGDAEITRHYFYGYCRMAYYICDQRYQLAGKVNMDFYSLAHDYYMRLLMGDWQALERRRPGVSLSTWMTNGFRYLVLERLKAYHAPVELADGVGFDVPDDHFAEDVRETVEEIILRYFPGDRRSQGILRMMLIGGFSGREVAEQLGISPSAVSQRYQKMMREVIIPYFKRYYQSEAGTFAASLTDDMLMSEMTYGDFLAPAPSAVRHAEEFNILSRKRRTMDPQRITPDFIQQLRENEVFVFGSNLAGMHGGGAAYIAYRKFGAQMGQGVGLQGQSYAIPTMQGGVETIAPYVDEFILFAREHPELRFMVTRIGCGIAGFDAEDIAPLFREAAREPNICLPRDFWEVLGAA